MRHSTAVDFEHLGILSVSSLRFSVVLLDQQYSSSRGCVGYCTYCDRGDQLRLYSGCFVWSTPADGCGWWCVSVGYYRLLWFNRTTVVLIHTSRVVVLVFCCSRVVSTEVVSPVQP